MLVRKSVLYFIIAFEVFHNTLVGETLFLEGLSKIAIFLFSEETQNIQCFWGEETLSFTEG